MNFFKARFILSHDRFLARSVVRGAASMSEIEG